MTSKNQHVVPHGDKWAVRGQGNARITKSFNNKKEAVVYARVKSIKQNAELVIHNKDGKIAQKDSHGHDPFPPRG